MRGYDRTRSQHRQPLRYVNRHRWRTTWWREVRRFLPRYDWRKP